MSPPEESAGPVAASAPPALATNNPTRISDAARNDRVRAMLFPPIGAAFTHHTNASAREVGAGHSPASPAHIPDRDDTKTRQTRLAMRKVCLVVGHIDHGKLGKRLGISLLSGLEHLFGLILALNHPTERQKGRKLHRLGVIPYLIGIPSDECLLCCMLNAPPCTRCPQCRKDVSCRARL